MPLKHFNLSGMALVGVPHLKVAPSFPLDYAEAGLIVAHTWGAHLAFTLDLGVVILSRNGLEMGRPWGGGSGWACNASMRTIGESGRGTLKSGLVVLGSCGDTSHDRLDLAYSAVDSILRVWLKRQFLIIPALAKNISRTLCTD